MNFNIQLESIIQKDQLEAVNTAVEMSKSHLSTSIEGLYGMIKCCPEHLNNVEVGRTGSHIWMSDKYSAKRILLITQN